MHFQNSASARNFIRSSFVVLLTYFSHSSRAVFNGVQPGGNHPDFPAVVQIINENDFACSGVFIGPFTMLTALHCLSNKTTGGVSIYGTENESIGAVYYSEEIFDKCTQVNGEPPFPDAEVGSDFAIVIFDSKKLNQPYVKIHPKLKMIGQPVVISGLGISDPEAKVLNADESTRLIGYSKIQGRLQDKSVYSTSAALDKKTTDGSNAGSLGGDSGGGLFDKTTSELIGTVVGRDKDSKKNTLVSKYSVLLNKQNYVTFQKAKKRFPEAISDEIMALLDAHHDPNSKKTDETDQNSAKPSENTPKEGNPTSPSGDSGNPNGESADENSTGASENKGSASNAINSGSHRRKYFENSPVNFFHLDEGLSKQIKEKFQVQLTPGLYFSDQEATDQRPDLKISLNSEEQVTWTIANDTFSGRVGFSIDDLAELWLITEFNTRYLLRKNDGNENLFLSSPKHYFQAKDSVIYFDENWIMHEKSLDGKTTRSYQLRVYTKEFNPRVGEKPLMVYHPQLNKLLLANWSFTPKGDIPKGTPPPPEFEISLIDLSEPDFSDRVSLVATEMTWPFFFNLSGVFREIENEAKNRVLIFQDFSWSDGTLSSSREVLTLSGDLQISFQSGSFNLVKKNPNGTSSTLIFDSNGRLVKGVGKSSPFTAVTEEIDQAIGTLPANPSISDYLELPYSAPLYGMKGVTDALVQKFTASRGTWVVLVYSEGQMPEELIKSFVQFPSHHLSFDRAWSIPADSLFDANDETQLEETYNTLLESLDGKRSLGVFHNFPATRAESVESQTDSMNYFLKTFERPAREGSCRILLTMKDSVYEEVTRLLPSFLKNASIITVPKLDKAERKRVASVSRRRLEQEYAKIFNDAAFDQILNFADGTVKVVESPQNEELVLRSFLDWLSLQTIATSEIGTDLISQYQDSLRSGASSRVAKFDVDALEADLKKNMVGHHDVIKELVKLLRPLQNGTKIGNRPIYFMLTGTPGVGKSRLAKLIAKGLTGDDTNILDFKIITNLDATDIPIFKQLRANPHQLHVVIFDDVDRARYDDFDKMRSIFVDGYYNLGSKDQVPFANTVVILTSNWGTQRISDNTIFDGNFMEGLRRDIVKQDGDTSSEENPRGKISERFWSAISSRIYVMRPFTESQLWTLATKFVDDHTKAILNSTRRTVRIHPVLLLQFVSKQKADTSGARSLENTLPIDVYPAYETVIANPKVTEIIIVEGSDGATAITNLDSSFRFWKKNMEATLQEIETKGVPWFFQDGAQWSQDHLNNLFNNTINSTQKGAP